MAVMNGWLLAVPLGVLAGCPTDECGQSIGVPMRRGCPVELREGLWDVQQNPKRDSCELPSLEVGPGGEFEVSTGPSGSRLLDPMDDEAPFECRGFDGELDCDRGEPVPLMGEGLSGEVQVQRSIDLQFTLSTMATGTRTASLRCAVPECDAVALAQQAGVSQLPCSVSSSLTAQFIED